MTIPDLLAELERRGIQLAECGDRLRFSPQGRVTPVLLRALRTHKSALLAILKAPRAFDAVAESSEASPSAEKKICGCGSMAWRDVAIHDGRSVRRDCARCGRFLEFPVWYGQRTGHKDQ